jgi:hypothetical protein
MDAGRARVGAYQLGAELRCVQRPDVRHPTGPVLVSAGSTREHFISSIHFFDSSGRRLESCVNRGLNPRELLHEAAAM